MALLDDLLLSCWTVEAARSSAFERRGHQDSAVRAAARARILAARCAAEKIKLVPNYATRHADFLSGVAGSEEQTGILGLIFLERVGVYINAHTQKLLSAEDHAELLALAEPDLDAVNQALMEGKLTYPPPAEFPSAPVAEASGQTLARFGILGDPHVGLADAAVARALEQMAQEKADFVVAIGDVTQSGLQEEFSRARKLFDESPIPVVPTLGNHDLWVRNELETPGLEKFRSEFSVEPNAVHEQNGARMVVIDSTNPEVSPFPPYDTMGGEFLDDPPHTVPGGIFSEQTRTWLASLEKAGPTFLALHHPPFPYFGMPPLIFGLDEQNTEILSEVAQRLNVQAILAGHTHRCYKTELHGIPVIEVASAADWPFGFSMIEVTDREWSFNLRPIDYDPGLDPTNHRDYLFRRFATGPQNSRAFVEPLRR
ncbi:MAG: metallophosphoesterase family protein [Actinomycetota bacterium]